jgi:hypothetical protein
MREVFSGAEGSRCPAIALREMAAIDGECYIAGRSPWSDLNVLPGSVRDVPARGGL